MSCCVCVLCVCVCCVQLPELRSLDLCGNQMRRVGSVSVAKAVIVCTHMELLSLDENCISEAGLDEVRNMAHTHTHTHTRALLYTDSGIRCVHVPECLRATFCCLLTCIHSEAVTCRQ